MLSTIVLAAGSSKRMGNSNKLLYPFRKRTVIETTIAQILGTPVGELIVVTGKDPDEVHDILSGLPLVLIHNSDYENGMTSSIQKGVMAASGQGYMICLGDMPLITPEEYSLIQKSFEERIQLDSHCICVPEYHQQKGNPVVFSSFYRKAILHHKEPEGCRGIVQSSREHVVPVYMSTDHTLLDMDTPDDYRRLLNKGG